MVRGFVAACGLAVSRHREQALVPLCHPPGRKEGQSPSSFLLTPKIGGQEVDPGPRRVGAVRLRRTGVRGVPPQNLPTCISSHVGLTGIDPERVECGDLCLPGVWQ